MVVVVTVVVGVGMVVAMVVIAYEGRLGSLHVLGERRTHRGTALVVVVRELVVPRRERPLLRLGLGLGIGRVEMRRGRAREDGGLAQLVGFSWLVGLVRRRVVDCLLCWMD